MLDGCVHGASNLRENAMRTGVLNGGEGYAIWWVMDRTLLDNRSTYKQIQEWCQEQFGIKSPTTWNCLGYYFYFKTQADRTAFIFRWCTNYE